MTSKTDASEASCEHALPGGAASAAALIRELQLHQLELEAQNQQLREAHEQLEHSRARYMALYDFAPVAFFGVDAGTTVHEVNLAGAALLEQEPSRVLGYPLARYLEGDHAVAVRLAIAGVLRTGGGACQRATLKTRGGQVREIQLQMMAFDDGEGRRICRISATDITPIVAARAEAAQADERYRALLAGVPDAVLRLSREGELLDSHFPGGTPEVAGPACILGALRQRIASVLEHRTAESFEHQVEGAGATRWLEVRLLPSGTDEVTAVCRDVTELRQVEARLRLTERMAAIGTLAAGVAHEINNPLAYVMTCVQLAERRLSGPALTGEDRAELNGTLGDLRSGVERIRSIIRNLVEFSHPAEGPRVAVDPREVLEASLRMARNELQHRARIVRELGEVPRVLADPVRLGQVFLNLLINAAHAIPDGDAEHHAVTVRTAVGPSGAVEIAIEDTGHGISPEVRSRIFEPFFTTKPPGQGVGLGLAIVHAAVKSLDGELTVDSGRERGSVFRVHLPPATVTPESAEVRARSEERPERLPRARILIIDDEANFGRTMRMLLSDRHDVVDVTSAEEGLQRIARGEQFDVVLCDLMMPTVSGRDLHQRLGRVSGELADRIIFMTGGAFTAPMQEFLQSVKNPRLMKPFRPDELEAALAVVLRRAPPTSSAPRPSPEHRRP